MAKLDKLKEEIGWLKIAFGIFIATDISLVAWLVQNYNKADIFLLIIFFVWVGIITAIIFFSTKRLTAGLTNWRICDGMVPSYRFYDFHDGPGYCRYTGDQKWGKRG